MGRHIRWLLKLRQVTVEFGKATVECRQMTVEFRQYNDWILSDKMVILVMIRFEIMATELCQTTVELGVGNGWVG